MDDWFVQVKECGGDGGGVSYFAEKGIVSILSEESKYPLSFEKSSLCETFYTIVIHMKLFLPHDAMHKGGLCCRPVSVCLSVRPSVTLMYFIDKAEDLVKFLSRSGSPIILVF